MNDFSERKYQCLLLHKTRCKMNFEQYTYKVLVSPLMVLIPYLKRWMWQMRWSLVLTQGSQLEQAHDFFPRHPGAKTELPKRGQVRLHRLDLIALCCA